MVCVGFGSFCAGKGGLEFPTFDGKDRVLSINKRNYKKALKKHDMLCVLYHEPLSADKGLQKQLHMTEMVLEVSQRRICFLDFF